MIRAYLTSEVSVRQSIDADTESRIITHEISYHNRHFNVYKVFRTESFDKACECYEELERLAREYNERYSQFSVNRHDHILATLESNMDG